MSISYARLNFHDRNMSDDSSKDYSPETERETNSSSDDNKQVFAQENLDSGDGFGSPDQYYDSLTTSDESRRSDEPSSDGSDVVITSDQQSQDIDTLTLRLRQLKATYDGVSVGYYELGHDTFEYMQKLYNEYKKVKEKLIAMGRSCKDDLKPLPKRDDTDPDQGSSKRKLGRASLNPQFPASKKQKTSSSNNQNKNKRYNAKQLRKRGKYVSVQFTIEHGKANPCFMQVASFRSK